MGGCASSCTGSSLYGGLGKDAHAVETAIDTNNEESLRKLLANGATTEGVRDNGGSALTRCVHDAHVQMVAILLDYGADVHSKDCYGRNPLDIGLIRYEGQPSNIRLTIITLLKKAMHKTFCEKLQDATRNGDVGTIINLSPYESTRGKDVPESTVETVPRGSNPDIDSARSEESTFTNQFTEARKTMEIGGEFKVADHCVVCHEERLEIAVLPCKHECLCRTCAIRIIALHVQGVKSMQTCAICRAPVESLLITNSQPREIEDLHNLEPNSLRVDEISTYQPAVH